MSLPSKISSSFCALDSETSTPFNMSTCRTICREDIGIRFDNIKGMQLPFRPRSYGSQEHVHRPG